MKANQAEIYEKKHSQSKIVIVQFLVNTQQELCKFVGEKDQEDLPKRDLSDSIKNKNVQFAIWSMHIISVGFIFTTLVILWIVFLIVKHVNMTCVKRVR